MNEVKLSSPWVLYYRKLEALFGNDPDIEVEFDADAHAGLHPVQPARSPDRGLQRPTEGRRIIVRAGSQHREIRSSFSHIFCFSVRASFHPVGFGGKEEEP